MSEAKAGRGEGTVRVYRNTWGRMFIEFSEKPNPSLLASLRFNGWKYQGVHRRWWNYDVMANWEFANELAREINQEA